MRNAYAVRICLEVVHSDGDGEVGGEEEAEAMRVSFGQADHVPNGTARSENASSSTWKSGKLTEERATSCKCATAESSRMQGA